MNDFDVCIPRAFITIPFAIFTFVTYIMSQMHLYDCTDKSSVIPFYCFLTLVDLAMLYFVFMIIHSKIKVRGEKFIVKNIFLCNREYYFKDISKVEYDWNKGVSLLKVYVKSKHIYTLYSIYKNFNQLRERLPS